jgi:NAD+ diphosphatase
MPIITPSRPNFYTGGTLDRAGHLRTDDAWIAEAFDNPASRFVLFWRGKTLIADAGTAAPRAFFTAKPAADDVPWVFLGLQDGTPYFAANLTHLEAPHEVVHIGDSVFSDLYSVNGVLGPDDATLIATSRAMLHWRQQTKFCCVCGHPNAPTRGGYVMQCSSCKTEHFPRTDPAVIMLVTRNNKMLLGQSLNFPVDSNFYSTLAGFVEPGESLEDAVRREVFEEVGIKVGEVHYHSSQPWPFPASLMLGFYGEGLNDDIVLEATEMRDAKWCTPEEVINCKELGFQIPPPQSIARLLIDDWLASVR